MSKLTLGSFTSCCRLCLSEKTDILKPLFDISNDDKGLPEKISAFVEIKITSSDKISTMVCNHCVAIVNSWQLFKKTCTDNQTKLMDLLQQWNSQHDLLNMSLQIKEEPLDEPRVADQTIELTDEEEPNYSNTNVSLFVKTEPNTDDYNCEQPPQLTPFDGEVDEGTVMWEKNMPEIVDRDRHCSICNKLFSNVSNKKRHDRMKHSQPNNQSVSNESSGLLQIDPNHDDRSQNSADSVMNADKEVARVNSAEVNENDHQKIQFAAGLKLFQNSTPPISQENLSKIENSYIEKCKAMVTMFKTLECACHNVMHNNLKGLLSHLRALRIWFPVFTCYNCMITFTDRSSSYRHNAKCPSANLETLVKLSNLKKRSEVKTRLYQNYKCTDCKYMYSFHEDFCKHVDEDHIPEETPCTCTCGKEFSSTEDYKEHIYFSCMVQYYCDICFVTTNTLDEFQKHASEVHDNSEGFILLQDDNYRKRRPPSEKEEDEEEVVVTGKRKSTFYNKPLVEAELEEVVEPPPKRPVGFSSKPTTCPVCLKQYSSYANMMRHYKTHTEEELQNGMMNDQEESIYCCPDCGGMFGASEWEAHKESHDKHSCSECGKLFQFQSELDQHRSVHLNLKLYRDSKTSTYKSTMLSPNSENKVLVLCEICDAIFQTKEELKEHKLIHENYLKTEIEIKKEVDSEEEKRWECKPCNKRYSGYSGLWDHNKKKHPEVTSTSNNFPKQCPDCDKVLYTGGSWFMHKQMHERIAQTLASNSPVPDSSAKQTPSRSKRASVEKRSNDEDESYFTCKKCFKVFSRKYNLKNHMKCHGINLTPSTKANTKAKVIKKVWCDVCHQSCDSNESLKKHKEEEHGSKSSHMEDEDVKPSFELKNPFIFTCDVCTKTFTTKIALKKHKERHALEDTPPVTKKTVYVYCKYCKIPFATVELLNKHMSSEHNEEVTKPKVQQQEQKIKQFACSVCRKAFMSAAALHAHQGWHKRGKVEKQIKTQEKLFRKMVTNLSKPQTQAPQFQCTTCLMQFPNDTALQIHILEKHRNVNAVVLTSSLKCQPCNQEFSSQEEYDHHKRLHEVVEKQQKFAKNFPCNYCPAAFSRSDTLSTHMRTIHKELVQTEFKCNQCDRAFDKHSALQIHLKIHEKQKNSSVSSKPLFQCSICNMGFDLPKDLRAHTIKAHPF